MLESESKGLIFNVNNFTIVDKKTGKESGMINIQYIYENPNESATRVGWQSGQAYFIFNDDLWKYLKGNLLKNCTFKFKLIPDYKDSTKYTSKLVQVNDYIIKQ